MKKSVIFLVLAMLSAILYGCILSKSPNTNKVNMAVGEQKTFTINVFPSKATYAWTLDGASLPNTGKSYVYTAMAGNHILKVKAKQSLGTDTQTWSIITLESTYSLSGTVTLSGGGALQDVTITLSGTSSRTTTTNVSGVYSFTGLANGSYTITPTLTGYSFIPVSRMVTVNGSNVTTINFVGVADLIPMVNIPAGTFMMGSTVGNPWDETAYHTTPVHSVTLQAFKIGAYEVTQAQYEAIMGTNPSYFQEKNGYPNTENNPVEQVTWYEARQFCTALSTLTGRTFTLPSEAQWEYACRAGTTTLYSYGDSDSQLGDYAWYASNSGGTTHPVGTKLPNPWGLYDMHGSVWEWCLDEYHVTYDGAPTDGSAWGVPWPWGTAPIRGGSWFVQNYDWWCRSAIRYDGDYDETRVSWYGFRIVEIP
jgi:formylglycine-generating enzyme required for sulfatase activity